MKIIYLSIIASAIFLVGYYSGLLRSEEKDQVVRQQESKEVAPTIEESSPLTETELAGGDTCTVLPPKLELSSGALCEVIDETTFVVEDEPANYECSDGTWLAGTPNREAKLWTIRQVFLISGEGDPENRIESVRDVDIKKAWR